MNKTELVFVATFTGAIVLSVRSIRKNLKLARENEAMTRIIEAQTEHINTLNLEVGRQVASTFEDVRIAIIEKNL